ncbi:MAG: hypothetical protein K9M82_03890 [Deltaproteobacteria bacterium]|nr:hypothetical protein [Deltaproteobacteria bacterium]
MASVQVPVAVSTPYLYFAGLSDSVITKTVKIEGRDGHPIQIQPLSFDLEDKAVFRIDEVKPGREFHVEVSTIPGRAGTFLGALELKTNHPQKPTLTIRIRGRIKQAPAGAGAVSPGEGAG